jgi:hypothetical protein
VPESPLILKRVSASGFPLIRRVERRRLSDVLTDGVVVRRIFKVHAAPVGCRGSGRSPLGIMGRSPTRGYAATREAAMAAFAKSWRRE